MVVVVIVEVFVDIVVVDVVVGLNDVEVVTALDVVVVGVKVVEVVFEEISTWNGSFVLLLLVTFWF